ncbi:MAG TPA: BON domain-containing protein [Candidatus Polarisedimenticolia bacterium]|nr:BON domain-containing protein [Candidatus Polarisedimenticolia bacterium]
MTKTRRFVILALLAAAAAGRPWPARAGGDPAGPPSPPPGVRRNIAGPGDYALREKLIQGFSRDPDLGQEKFTVILVNGGAVFSGPIKSCALKMRALQSAAFLRGIINVTDEMTVPHADLRDEALRQAVAAGLTEAAGALGLKLQAVTVSDGVATIEGAVHDFGARVKAEEIAGRVLGVTRVSNHLKPADAPAGNDDASLQKSIVAYLGDWRQYQFSGEILVKVRDGVVTLSGRVPFFMARQQAAVMVSLAAGVTRVDNRLKVDPSLVMRLAAVTGAP